MPAARRSISADAELFRQADEKVKRLKIRKPNMNFSRYVQGLIEDDVASSLSPSEAESEELSPGQQYLKKKIESAKQTAVRARSARNRLKKP